MRRVRQGRAARLTGAVFAFGNDTFAVKKVGALWGWGVAGPDGVGDRIHFAIEAFVVMAALYGLTRVTNEAPAVGEPPPDDPALTLRARFRSKLGHLGLALMTVLIAWDQLR